MSARLKQAWIRAFYWWGTYVSTGLLCLLTRWTVEGRRNVPDGPLIVASNHLNNADPMILCVAVRRRRLRFMAKAELFSSALGPIVRSWGAFKVHRGQSDRVALRQAEAIVAGGEMLAMFPEGTRSRTGQMGELHRGTAMIALRTGAPLLPCGLTGTEHLGRPLRLLKRPRMSVRIGKPIVVSREPGPLGVQASVLTERLEREIKALLPPEYRGPYTGEKVGSSIDDRDPQGE